jgi:acetylornithine deacetylase
VSDHLPDVLRILECLVGFDTTSPNSNLPLIEYVEHLLADTGALVRRIPDPVLPKASLWVTIGPRDRAGYILSGHTDTVPVTGQAWSSDPYRLRRHDGRVYGRGTVDMKGFLAVCLAGVPAMQRAGLRTPIHLAISYDEEVGCTGVRPMLAELAREEVRPRGCFVGEPTGMRTVIGHKSKHSMRAVVHGKACHSALTTAGVNAVEAAAELVLLIRAKAAELAASGMRDLDHDPPFTTGLTTIMAGGIANNIVPDRCEVEFEFRGIAADDLAAICAAIARQARSSIEPRMKAVDPSCHLAFDSIIDYPALETARTAPITTLAQSLGGSAGTSKVSFGTEAGLFDRMAGIASVVIGPGSIEQAHKPDEWVAISELASACGFVDRLIAHCASE